MYDDSVKYIEAKSKEILKELNASFEGIERKAGIVIGLLTLIVPIHLFIFEKANIFIRITSFVPILFLIYSILQMLKIMRSEALNRGYNVDKFEEFINFELVEVKKYEIAANKLSIQKNQKILQNLRNMYNRGITAITFSIITSIILIVIFMFSNTAKGDYKMHSDDRKNTIQETQSSSESTKQTQAQSETKLLKETLPKVTEKDLFQFSEGSRENEKDSNDKK